MKIVKHSNNCLQIDNTIYNLSLEDNYKKVKSILSEKEFNELFNLVPKVTIKDEVYNIDYIDKHLTKKEIKELERKQLELQNKNTE